MVDWLGIIAIVFFYVLILIVGIWAGRKTDAAKQGVGEQTEEVGKFKKWINSELQVMLAGRNIGTLVGIFTMTGQFKFPLGKIHKSFQIFSNFCIFLIRFHC